MSSLEYYKSYIAQKDNYFLPGSSPKPVAAPIGGWDAISPLANMQQQFAVTLQNWYPRPGWVELRGGYNVWANVGTSVSINSLLIYRPTSGNERMFAAAGTNIYEVTNAGVGTVAFALATNDKWQSANFTVPGGSSYLVSVNGNDAPLYFDGTSWTNPTITGVTTTPKNFIQVISHQQRLFFVEKNSMRVWYLGVQAISGVANVVDVGSFCTKGGFVQSISAYTLDGGNGPNTMLVIMTNRGQCVIYQGTDPTSPTAWNLVGVFDLAPPIGTRCFTKIGSDLAIITTSGLIPLSKALPFNPSSQRELAFTMRIQNAVLQAAQLYSTNFGWEVMLYPAQTMMILNVPIQTNGVATQYVMNAITGAWCSFTGWNANCFERFNENLYFADNLGNVNIAYTGRTDFNNVIVADMKCAFNFFEQPGLNKNMTMVKPYLTADGSVTPTMGVDVDFGSSVLQAPITTTITNSALWDTGTWDVSSWSGGTITVANWYSVQALGTALAVRMKFNYGGTNGTNLVTSVGVFDSGTFDSAVFDGTGILTPNTNLPVLQVTAFETIQQPGGPV